MISRKGRQTKAAQIELAIKDAKSIEEVYKILDCSKFRLTSPEEIQIAQEWESLQEMKAPHGVGVYAQGVTA